MAVVHSTTRKSVIDQVNAFLDDVQTAGAPQQRLVISYDMLLGNGTKTDRALVCVTRDKPVTFTELLVR